MHSRKSSNLAPALFIALVGVAIIFCLNSRHPLPGGEADQKRAPVSIAPKPEFFPATKNLRESNSLAAAATAATFPSFQRRPFVIAEQTGHYGWTAEDGRQPLVIRTLAHNALEYQRMLDENGTIYRRQLVYQKIPFSLAAQKAVHFGEAISQLTLPNLDGQELTVDITKTEIEAGGDRGILTGKVAGRSDSLVSIAFIGGREGFTVVSPADKMYLYAEPREPGELVVKKFDPATYGGVLAGCGVK